MKLKMVVVDVELSRSGKRWVAGGSAAIAVLLVASVALAGLPHTFSSGEVLTAANLNADLQSLDGRLSTLESQEIFVAEVNSSDTAAGFAGTRIAAQAPTQWLESDGGTFEGTLSFARPFVTPPVCTSTMTWYGNGGDGSLFYVPQVTPTSVSLTPINSGGNATQIDVLICVGGR